MRVFFYGLALNAVFAPSVVAGTLLLPEPAIDRVAPWAVVYRLEHPITGTGSATLDWSDSLGRVVEERSWPITLSQVADIAFSIDLRRAVTSVNKLTVHLDVDCQVSDCPGGHWQDAATAQFVVPPWDDDWWDYQILMWQGQTERGYEALKAIGVTGAKMMAKDRPLSLTEGLSGALLAKDFRWYEENIATDFFAPYHRWFPDKPVNWKYLEVKAAHLIAPSSLQPFMREPSLSDPDWQAAIRDRLTSVVRAQKPFRPLFYNLGDETGIADLAAYWDFDFSPMALDAFRESLQQRYGTLTALNRQWGSGFGRWADVMPLTAAAAIRRKDQNFSAWADFREWMDISFAQALARGRDAVHAADPRALAAIEGGQIPGWGGYDYALLAPVLDVFEIYDAGNSVDLVHAFNPKAAILTTSFSGGPAEKWRVWRELLHGGRGLVLWDESSEFANGDGRLGERGAGAAGYFREIRSGLGALLANSDLSPASVAIHYSSASMRANWILEERKEGDKGLERASHPDHPVDDFTLLRQSFTDLFAELGLQYRFLSTQQIEDGALHNSAPRVLVLPRSIALSGAEIGEIKRFIQTGGLVVAVGRPGQFDEHVRKRREMPLKGAFGNQSGNLMMSAEKEVVDYRRYRGTLPAMSLRRDFGKWLRKSGVMPYLELADGATGDVAEDVEITVLRNGDIDLVGLLASAVPSPSAAGDRALRVSLPAASCIYDVRGKSDLGCRREFEVTLNPFEPVILALSPTPIVPLSISVPDVGRPGETVEIKIARQGDLMTTGIVHIDVLDPTGQPVSYYSGNLKTSGGMVRKDLPLAQNEQLGEWSILVTDVLTGRQQNVLFHVSE
ncbi:beta-galactosidase [Telmatospirillum sp.]|uniref:beta-galactosidase n=1 Tax=Telmatospirillum sp. TaxID=2079197 RepID=UPI00284BB5AA|nr:beta-galactosidase [Telmatospirillum sp.]MDR3439936.1 beta-galactosidase [Telmatospirillum sp.]